MKKVKRRTASLLSLVLLIVLGLSFYIYKYINHGAEWATFAANHTVYTDGRLSVGKIVDRNGMVLTDIVDGRRTYAEDETIRKATLHAVGDANGNIGTGALQVFSSKLVGFDLINGSYSIKKFGEEISLSIDADLNAVAYKALDGRPGVVAVSNYETGEIICMVSSTSYDPMYPPESFDDPKYDGVFINRFLSSSFTPGSVFKLITLTAAVDTMPDLFDRTFTCNGEITIGGERIICSGNHGEIQIENGLAYSCNCVFGTLASELGGKTLAKYAKKLGLTDSLDIDDIITAAGFVDADATGGDAAWSGIGQYTDVINPASMLRFVGGIANGGVAKDLTLLKDGKTGEEHIISRETAETVAELMNHNVYQSYGQENFPGLDLYAKSGTAQVGKEKTPHAWFVGYIKNEGCPYAFVVMVENGGSGSRQAGPIANTVMQAAVEKNN